MLVSSNACSRCRMLRLFLIYSIRRLERITEALISLHWLCVHERIVFKAAVLTYRALHGYAPPYLASQFTRVADISTRRRLRSTSTDQVTVPAYRWWFGVVVSALASINEVNQRRARLVLRWVTVSGFNSRWGTFISVCDQPPRSTQPDHPFVGRLNEYQPKGGDALRLGSKGRYGSCVGGR